VKLYETPSDTRKLLGYRQQRNILMWNATWLSAKVEHLMADLYDLVSGQLKLIEMENGRCFLRCNHPSTSKTSSPILISRFCHNSWHSFNMWGQIQRHWRYISSKKGRQSIRSCLLPKQLETELIQHGELLTQDDLVQHQIQSKTVEDFSSAAGVDSGGGRAGGCGGGSSVVGCIWRPAIFHASKPIAL